MGGGQSVVKKEEIVVIQDVMVFVKRRSRGTLGNID